MVLVGSLLESVLQKTFKKNILFNDAQSIARSWDSIMGKFSRYTGVLLLRDKCLVVWVESPQLLYELRLLEGVIIEAIAKEVPRIKINSLSFSLKSKRLCAPVEGPKKSTRCKQYEKRKQDEVLMRYLDHVTNHVEDNEMREVLKKLYLSCVV